MKRLAVLLCLAGLVAACGSGKDSGPVSLPPVSATAVPTSPTPSVAAVPKPADADAFTAVGAQDFVRYYVDVINAAIASNDPGQLLSLSAPECEGCANYVASIRKTELAGARVDPGSLHVIDAVAPPVQDGETIVLLRFDADEYVSRTADGRELNRFPAQQNVVAELRCVRRGDGWIVMGFRLASTQHMGA